MLGKLKAKEGNFLLFCEDVNGKIVVKDEERKTRFRDHCICLPTNMTEMKCMLC